MVNGAETRSIAVHKFGGSSLATHARIHNVAGIIRQHSNPHDFIVVSANGCVTDWLVAYSEGIRQVIDQLAVFYRDLAQSTLARPVSFLQWFESILHTLAGGQLNDTEILSLGEMWSANLMAACLEERGIAAVAVDARALLRTDEIDDFKSFDLEFFDTGITSVYEHGVKPDDDLAHRLIVTGFIASDSQGRTITLGRNGSDYTASLLARFSGADRVTLWTDVPGIYTADPRLVKSARPIAQISYDEAVALAAVGTNVLHQKTINPLLDQNIPLHVRSSLQPEQPGTRISRCGDPAIAIKTVALKPDLIKIKLPELKMADFEKIKHRLFEASIPSIASTVIDEEGEGDCVALLVGADAISKAYSLFEKYKVRTEILSARRAVLAIVGEGLAKYEKLTHPISPRFAWGSQVSAEPLQQEFVVIDQGLANAVFLETCASQAVNILEGVYAASFEGSSADTTVAEAVELS